MKKLYAWIIPFIILVVFSCNDEYESINTFRRPYTLYRSYPIYLNTTGIFQDPQVLASRQSENTFKIAADKEYIFVGEKKKGIHVYSRVDSTHALPLCFIECKEIKALELKDHLLYCNNFVDLLVLDVRNPLQAKLLLREKEFFNKYQLSSWNCYKYFDNQYAVGSKDVVLSGIETQDQPLPDFKEYDELYGHLVVNEIPDSLYLPVVGLTNAKNGIYTYGQSNTLASCIYNSGSIYSTPAPGTYLPSLCYNGLSYSNGILFSAGFKSFSGYACDTDWIFSSRYMYWHYYSPTDFLYIAPYNIFVFVAKESWIYLITGKSASSYSTFSAASGGGKCLALVRDQFITLGDNLMVYNAESLKRSELKIDKIYPDIYGSCLFSQGNTLIVSNKSGLLCYDVTDLNNIKQIK